MRGARMTATALHCGVGQASVTLGSLAAPPRHSPCPAVSLGDRGQRGTNPCPVPYHYHTIINPRGLDPHLQLAARPGVHVGSPQLRLRQRRRHAPLNCLQRLRKVERPPGALRGRQQQGWRGARGASTDGVLRVLPLGRVVRHDRRVRCLAQWARKGGATRRRVGALRVAPLQDALL